MAGNPTWRETKWCVWRGRGEAATQCCKDINKARNCCNGIQMFGKPAEQPVRCPPLRRVAAFIFTPHTPLRFISQVQELFHHAISWHRHQWLTATCLAGPIYLTTRLGHLVATVQPATFFIKYSKWQPRLCDVLNSAISLTEHWNETSRYVPWWFRTNIRNYKTSVNIILRKWRGCENDPCP